MQAHISGSYIEDFALVSDSAYVAQNGGRIIRALLEIAISRKWANATLVLMNMSKAIEKRMWPFDHPLKQFKSLKADVIYNLEQWAEDWDIPDLAAMSAKELGELIHLNEIHGAALLNAVKELPSLDLSCSLRPLGSDVLKLIVQVRPGFKWNKSVHGGSEPFYLWVEDDEGTTIIQLVQLLIRPETQQLEFNFVISVPSGRPPPSVTIRAISDRWMGSEDELVVSLDALHMPSVTQSHTPRLDLPFLRSAALKNTKLQSDLGPRVHDFNAIQSQIFWSLMKTRMHALVCGPTGCGKSVLAQLLLWYVNNYIALESTLIHTPSDTMSKASPHSWALVIAPQRNIAMELIADLRHTCKRIGVNIEMVVPDDGLHPVENRTIKVIAAPHLPSALGSLQALKSLNSLHLVVCENLEQLHPAYELGVSLIRHATQAQTTRFVGISASLNDPADLAAWLDAHPFAIHSFRPRDRDQSLSISTQSFTIPQSAALFKAMAKPCHAAIKTAGPDGSAMVFVPSRGQCRPIAMSLITQAALESATGRGYMTSAIAEAIVAHHLVRFRDSSLRDFVSSGVGFFHDGIGREDRRLTLELYAEGIIRVLLVSREACWTIPVRAGAVIVLGTQYLHVDSARDERQVRDYSHTEIVRMQSRAVRHNEFGGFHLFCQAESKDTYTRFLDDGLPLESDLHHSDVLSRWYASERRSGGIAGKQSAIDALSWTLLARRMVSNPTYYDVTGNHDDALSRIVDDLDRRATS
jgi:antiviral helicase SLH1